MKLKILKVEQEIQILKYINQDPYIFLNIPKIFKTKELLKIPFVLKNFNVPYK